MVGTEIFHLHRSVRKPRRLACDNMELINLSHKNKKLFNIGKIGAANTSYTTETDDDAHHAKVDYRRITTTIQSQASPILARN